MIKLDYVNIMFVKCVLFDCVCMYVNYWNVLVKLFSFCLVKDWSLYCFV